MKWCIIFKPLTFDVETNSFHAAKEAVVTVICRSIENII